MSFGTKELNRRCNNIIKDYLDKGFELSPCTMGGSYSGRSYMDLYNPKEKNCIYRIWFIDSDERVADCRYASTLVLHVKKYINTGRRPWPDEGEDVYKKVFYVVSFNKAYTEDKDELLSIIKLHKDRLESKKISAYDEDNRRIIKIQKLPESFIDHVMEKINNIRGFRRATASCINSVMLYNETRYNYTKPYKVMRCKVEYAFNNKCGTLIIG